jgi:choline dehydrogenase-like flavoprotein
MTLTAATYVLAAGALASPRLLLQSQDCANSSGWVGRGLMFHVNEIFAIWPKRGQQFAGAAKAISLRDLYTYDGVRLGMIQSMGLEASFGNIALYLAGLYDRSALHRFRKLRKLTNIPALIAARILGHAKVFVGILEDLPYPDNRVTLHPDDPDVPTFNYTISAELLKRRSLFRRQIKRSFRGYRTLLMGQKAELNYGHPCGTLRFGDDPATSVLDARCKAHDLDNLYVADASVFPTSMGVNPSLMIAANALRVADGIVAATHHAKRGA